MNDLALRKDELDSLAELGDALRSSGFFKDVASVAQASVKVLAGRELGLGPVEAMRSLHIIEGKIEMSADLLAQRVKAHPKYDYRVVELTNTRCEIAFCQFDSEGVAQELGSSVFTMDDAERAGLVRPRTPWVSYPRNMLFARAVSNGVAWFCPDVAGGGRIYVDGEIQGPEYVGNESELARFEPVIVELPSGEATVDTQTGEIDPTPEAEMPAASGDDPSQEWAPLSGEPVNHEPVPDKGQPATKAQKTKLVLVARDLGWDEDRRHHEAGVGSFTHLTKARASELIEAWSALRGEGADPEPEPAGGQDIREGVTPRPAAAKDHLHTWGPSKVSKFEICTVEGCLETRRKGSE
jgi:hypothetical protein